MLVEFLIGFGIFIGYYVIAGQQRLYRAKSCVDLCVVIALTSVIIAPNHFITQYIDAIGCIIVALYLLYNGIDIQRKNKNISFKIRKR